METITPTPDTLSENWEPQIKDFTQELIEQQVFLSSEEKETLLKDSINILSKCAKPDGGNAKSTGLVFGYVQSGKTLSFTTVTTLAKDNDYRVVIVIAGTSNNLLSQTSKRLNQDLLIDYAHSRDYKLFENPTTDEKDSIKNSLLLSNKPMVLITVLKHYKHIDNLTKIFTNHDIKDILKNNAILIIDDEADQASLNTYARTNTKNEDWVDDKLSSTYLSLFHLRNIFSNYTFLQYTATPQAPLLISLLDILSPQFHVVLTPGKSYTGGKQFFIDHKEQIIKIIPKAEEYHNKDNPLTDIPESLIEALSYYFINALIQLEISQNFSKTKNFASMLIHADLRIFDNEKISNWISQKINSWLNSLDLPSNDIGYIETYNDFKNVFDGEAARLGISENFSDYFPNFIDLLRDTNIVKVIKNKNIIEWNKYRSHILIGAQKLDRGFTVENLLVTYMPRRARSKQNADTIQQRCRFFGYRKKYFDSCRVYLPQSSVYEYESYINHEESLRRSLQNNSLGAFKRMMLLDESLNPTRSNILSKKLVRNKLSGWRQFNAHTNTNNLNLFQKLYFEKRDSLQNTHEYFHYQNPTKEMDHKYLTIKVDELMDIISDFNIISPSDSMRKQATLQYLYPLKKKEAYLVFMSPEVLEGRTRKISTDTSFPKINNIWSGPSNNYPNDPYSYPGDKAIKFDEVTVQIHLINPRERSEYITDKFYTIGIYYPERYAQNFVGVEEENDD